MKIVTIMVKDIYSAKEREVQISNEDLVKKVKNGAAAAAADYPAADTHESFEKYVRFLLELVQETVEDVFKWEKENQNPPWMPQKSLAKEKRQLPKSEAQLLDRVKREISIFFGYEKRSQKENLIVRWSQKRRDRVDQILVRELHAEEQTWTDYHKDETMVKDHLAETMMKILLEDTANELIKVFKM